MSQTQHISTTHTFTVDGMDCASCVSHVSKAASKLAGVQTCNVNLAMGRAIVEFDPTLTNPDAVATAITKAGYPATPQISGHHHGSAALEKQQAAARAWRNRAIAGLALWFPVEAAHWLMSLYGEPMHMHGEGWLTWTAVAASTLSMIYLGSAFYRSALAALLQRTSNMDTLIALGATVAYGYSLIALAGHLWLAWMPAAYYFMEASGLLALISLGHWLEARARDSAGDAVRSLMTLAPSTALKLDDAGNPHETTIEKIGPGDLFLVRPGDAVAVDGVVTEGTGSVDESMITGEPIPASRTIGDAVIGGTINRDGRLVIRATRVGSDTDLAKIVALVDHAQNAKPPVQQLADRIAAVFVPVVLSIAAITAIGWYAWGATHSWNPATTWAHVANASCSVLIIACPCALGLALPAALMVGTGMGARRGILIRDIDALQSGERVRTIALDKTGTLTVGKPTVDRIIAIGSIDEGRLLQLAASASRYSSHPLSKALLAEAQRRGLALLPADSFSNLAGLGLKAMVDGQSLLIGNHALMHANQIALEGEPAGTIIYIASNALLLGHIELNDPVRPDAADAIAQLKRLGLRTVLLTGDNQAAATRVGRELGIDDVRAGVRPDQKAAAISSLQNQTNAPVAMVGDGINDAPALAQADLGIAIGSGSDIAKDAGDIVLVSHRLASIAQCLTLSTAIMTTIRRNLFFAFAYNVVAIPLAAMGLLNPLVAAGAMALSDITVIGSALWLKRKRF